jgi:hypothetical protein
VQQRRAQGLGVEPQAGADLRDLDRMGDEVLARLAALVGVALAGEREGTLDRRPVDPVVAVDLVLADDREEVAQQGPFLGRQVLGDVVDGGRGPVRLLGADLDVAAAIDRGGCPVVLRFPFYVRSLRYRRPSS